MSKESPCSLWLVSVVCGLMAQCLCCCEIEMTWKKIVDSFKVPSQKKIMGYHEVPSQEVVDYFKVPSQKVVDF